MPADAGARPLGAKAPFALFVIVLALHGWAATVGWHHGMLPGNGFRQAQTGLTTYFIQQERELSLAYPTPVLGKPWSIPMEFPLYEWTVAGLNRATGGPLVETARLVTLACFYLTLPALWLLLGALGLGAGRRWIALAFALSCPVYIFYSRAFLIESMALMLAAWFVTALLLALQRSHRGWLTAAALLGTLAAVVKITTLMLFLVPVAAGLGWQCWLAARGRERERGAARRRIFQAAAAFVLPLVLGVAWIVYSDSVKALNPAADMLRSGPQRRYNFGIWADRLSPDYWHRWIHLSTDAAIHPAVFGAVVLAAILSRRWRWFILSGIGLFILAPAVFPFLYAWHDYYYYANAGFLAVAMGGAALALLDSRCPRWLGSLVVLGALALQFNGYRTRYLPEQRVPSNGHTGLTELLLNSTNFDDVLVVAGQDWSSILPYSAQRRALMIRNGYEYNGPYLDQAFGNLRDEYVAALILTGGARQNTELINRAVAQLGIFPEPFLEHEDSVVYVNRTLRDEWSRRAPALAYNGIRLLKRNEAVPPLLTADVKDIHGKAVFANMQPMPVRFEVPFALGSWAIPRIVFNAHAATRLWFDLPAGPHRLKLDYGMLDSSWQGKDQSDGVEFAVSVEAPGRPPQFVWRRLLTPATVAADRGSQRLNLPFVVPAGAQVVVSTLPGPAGSIAFDWAYIARLNIK